MKYAPKLSHAPLSLSKNKFQPPPHIMTMLRLSPPLKKSPPIDYLIPSVLVGALPPVQTFLKMTLRQYVEQSFEESSESLDSELVSSSDELGDSSSSTASLALRFSGAWVRTRTINSALLPLILRPFCFRYIFSSWLVSAFTSFSIVQEISGRVFLNHTVF